MAGRLGLRLCRWLSIQRIAEKVVEAPGGTGADVAAA
jgi:hypothetical protein